MLPELENYLNKSFKKIIQPPLSSPLTPLPLQDQRPRSCFDQLDINSLLHPLEPSRRHRLPPVLPLICRAPAHQATSGKNDRFENPTSDLWSVLRDDLAHLVEPVHAPVQAEVGQLAVGGAGGGRCFVHRGRRGSKPSGRSQRRLKRWVLSPEGRFSFVKAACAPRSRPWHLGFA